MISVFKYLLIYLLIIMTSSLVYSQYQQIILFLSLGIASILILAKKTKITNKLIIIINLFVILLLSLYLYSEGSYTLGSMVNTLAIIFITYIYTKYIGYEFIDRYINIMYIITIISIFGYINDLTGFGDFFVNKLPSFLDYTPHLQSVKGGFLFAFNKLNHIGRNSGFCIEPGKYQYFINLALLFLLHFRKEKIIGNINKLIVFLIGVLTTFSAGAYIITGIIFLPYILEFNNNAKSKVFLFIICTILVMPNLDIINTKIIDKLEFNIETFSFERGSGNTRLNDIKLDIKIFKSNILGNGWNNYKEKWLTMAESDNYTTGSSSSSLTGSLAVYGIIVFLFIILLYINSIKRIGRNNFNLKVILYLFILIQTLTQSFLLTPLMIFLWFSDNILKLE